MSSGLTTLTLLGHESQHRNSLPQGRRGDGTSGVYTDPQITPGVIPCLWILPDPHSLTLSPHLCATGTATAVGVTITRLNIQYGGMWLSNWRGDVYLYTRCQPCILFIPYTLPNYPYSFLGNGFH